MKLKLIKPSSEYQRQITDMLERWFAVETRDEIVPWAICRGDYHDFEKYISDLSIQNDADGLVPDTTLFCYDEDADECVGAVNIRHYLNDRLLQYGGHIGDGVAPDRRGRGIGTHMVRLALDECRKMGINPILMVCEKENIASARTIVKNGGILENEIEDEGCLLQRYWINL